MTMKSKHAEKEKEMKEKMILKLIEALLVDELLSVEKNEHGTATDGCYGTATDGECVISQGIAQPPAKKGDLIGEHVLIRSRNSGVHYGVLSDLDKSTASCTLTSCRRIWSWSGAFTLSAVAIDGPNSAKLSKRLDRMDVVNDICEVIPLSSKALSVLDGIEDHDV